VLVTKSMIIDVFVAVGQKGKGRVDVGRRGVAYRSLEAISFQNNGCKSKRCKLKYLRVRTPTWT
jgi:hypothetical protein